MAKTICLGQEFDPELRSSLRSVLEEYGVTGEEGWWAVGAPDRATRAELITAGRILVLESDTYVGLTLTGEGAFVDEVSERVRARRLGAFPP